MTKLWLNTSACISFIKKYLFWRRGTTILLMCAKPKQLNNITHGVNILTWQMCSDSEIHLCSQGQCRGCEPLKRCYEEGTRTTNPLLVGPWTADLLPSLQTLAGFWASPEANVSALLSVSGLSTPQIQFVIIYILVHLQLSFLNFHLPFFFFIPSTKEK